MRLLPRHLLLESKVNGTPNEANRFPQLRTLSRSSICTPAATIIICTIHECNLRLNIPLRIIQASKKYMYNRNALLRMQALSFPSSKSKRTAPSSPAHQDSCYIIHTQQNLSLLPQKRGSSKEKFLEVEERRPE